MYKKLRRYTFPASNIYYIAINSKRIKPKLIGPCADISSHLYGLFFRFQYFKLYVISRGKYIILQKRSYRLINNMLLSRRMSKSFQESCLEEKEGFLLRKEHMKKNTNSENVRKLCFLNRRGNILSLKT